MNTSSCFCADGFLEFSSLKQNGLLTSVVLSAVGQEIPGHILERTHPSVTGKERFLVTPICLSGPEQIDFEALLEDEALAGLDIAGGFIQTRMPKRSEAAFKETKSAFFYLDHRTNFRFTFHGDENSALGKMKRDARARVRKILRERSLFSLCVSQKSEGDIETFANLYSETAQKSNFSELYNFTKMHWHILLQSNKWSLYFLKYNGITVAGCVVGSLFNGGFDYTFMGYKQSTHDVSRAMIIFLAEHMRNQGGLFLDLGGGIEEQDSLARFKLGLAGEAVPFQRYRFIMKTGLRGAPTSDSIKSLLVSRWP